MNRCYALAVACLFVVLGGQLLNGQEPDGTARKKSVTVYPVVITGSKTLPPELGQRIAEVLGVFLERAGMDEIEIGRAAFTPPASGDVSQLAGSFGRFVAKQRLKTKYALLAQFSGIPRISEIRTVVVEDTGHVVLADQADQETFSRSKIKPTNPMACTMFVASRLNKVWQLEDPQRQNAPQGKMAELLKKRSGIPPDEELAAMQERWKAARNKIATSTVTVYPVHLWPGSDASSAVQLAKLLSDQGIGQAQASDVDPQLTVQGDPNEQKVLWDTARAFRKFLGNHAPETEYALLADYGLGKSPDGKQNAHHVHFVLCDRTGQWVLVEFQNSHHSDFQCVNPKSPADCNRLVVERLKKRLSE